MGKNYFFLLLFFCIACGPRLETIEVPNEQGQIIERYIQHPETKLREGKHTRYYEDGTVQFEANYKHSLLDGEKKFFFPNGQIETIERYKAGRFEGLFQTYHKNGQLKLEGVYTNNEMGGSWKKYYESGVLMEEVTFAKNQENGPFIEYHENGQVKTQGNYLNGDDEHGELKMFDEQGELERIMDCKVGRCETTWRKTD